MTRDIAREEWRQKCEHGYVLPEGEPKTPEMLAIDALYWFGPTRPVTRGIADVADIAAVIRAAVAEEREARNRDRRELLEAIDGKVWEAVLIEREACARVADSWGGDGFSESIAAAIRQRTP